MSSSRLQKCAYGKVVMSYDDHKVTNKLEPHGLKYCGVHSFNMYEGVGIIDLKKWNYRLLVKIKDYIKNLDKKK